jgi:hypothetical protein
MEITVIIFVLIVTAASLFIILYLLFSHVSLVVKKEEEKKILQKFQEGLVKVAEKENVKLFFYDDFQELQKQSSSNHEISGVYKYIESNSEIYQKHKDLVDKMYPQIHVYNKESALCLAHELGHHFGIQYHKNDSEKFADFYIFELGKKILTDEEIGMLWITFKVYSKISEKELEQYRTIAIRNKIKNTFKFHKKA